MAEKKQAEEVNENVPGAPVTPPTNHDIYEVADRTVANSPEFGEVDEKEHVAQELEEDGITE